MNDIVEHDLNTGLELTRRILKHPSGKTVTIYEVWRNINGTRLPIGNGASGDEQSARQRYQSELAKLQGTAE